MKYLILIFGLPTLAIASSHDVASEPMSSSTPHIYIGAHTGWGLFQDACDDTTNHCDNNSLAMGIHGGYGVNQWFAVEFGFNDYGELDATYVAGKTNADVLALSISTKFSYPLTTDWLLFSRLGASYQKINKSSSWRGKQESDKWQPLVSFGIGYILSPKWSLRAEYQFIDGIGESHLGKSDLHVTSLGLTYHFVKSPTMTHQVERPIERPQFHTISVSSRPYFDFDSSTLNPKQELKNLATQINQSVSGQVTITGHTDNRGSERYNQALSEKRAQAVADYLIRNEIPKKRLKVSGQGEANPIADNSTPQGRAKNRRVDIHANIIQAVKE
ncbi:OmpA family protein [Vibrio owensii]|uniref:OmpA family protein n=1 Tax=Vibrio owensii TaxID=696485 RepID=UPI0018F2323A|nr:OmpA family protein [Vibrio owensii]